MPINDLIPTLRGRPNNVKVPLRTIDFNELKSSIRRGFNADYINYIYNKLNNSVLSKEQVASILSSIIDESGGDPFAIGDNGKAKGILQWHDDRYVLKSKDPYKELDNQIAHIIRTIHNTTDKKSWNNGGKDSGYNKAIDAYNDFTNGKSLDIINKGFALGFVRPRDKIKYQERLEYADKINKFIEGDYIQNTIGASAINKALTSNANIAKRLKQENRESVNAWDLENGIATHKMSWAEDDKGAFVYGNVNKSSGELIDYTRIPFSTNAGIDTAIESNDIIRMSPEEANWFTTNYKNYYPTFRYGGSMKKKKCKNGGFITTNIYTLRPIRRRYDIGGTASYRDTYGDISTNTYGAGAGIQGQTALNSATIGGGLGGAAGAATGAILSSTATAAAGAAAGAGAGATSGAALGSWMGPIGTALGALVGLGIGLFSGRRKKREAKKAAARADYVRQVNEGQSLIESDTAELSNNNPASGSINLYQDQLNAAPRISEYDTNTYGTALFGANPYSYMKCGGKTKKRKYAEGGQIIPTSSNTMSVEGPSHEQGGVQYSPQAEVEGGEAIMTDANNAYVFSDTLQYNGRTFAEIAEPIMKHKGALEERLYTQGLLLGKALALTDGSTYTIDRNTNARNSEKARQRIDNTRAEIMQTNAILTQLYNMQEAMKAEQGMTAEPKETMRCGGKTKKACGGKVKRYAPGGTISDPALFGQKLNIGANLLGNIVQMFGQNSAYKQLESMPIPQQRYIDRVNYEWDINTDSILNDITRQGRSTEKFITDNSSSSQVARQGVLRSRVETAKARGKVKQDELNQEMQMRNQGRMANAQIDAQNSQIKADNDSARYNHMMYLLGQGVNRRALLADTIGQLGRDISGLYQSGIDLQNLRSSNAVQMMSVRPSERNYLFNKIDDTTGRSMFGSMWDAFKPVRTTRYKSMSDINRDAYPAYSTTDIVTSLNPLSIPNSYYRGIDANGNPISTYRSPILAFNPFLASSIVKRCGGKTKKRKRA